MAPNPDLRISVALIEENRLVREGIASLLNRSRDIDVVAGLDLEDVSLLRHVAADIVLLAIGLDRGKAVLIAAHIKSDYPLARVIALDMLPVQEEIVSLVGAGVAGFVLKNATIEDLLRTIRAVAAGDSVLPATMIASLFIEMQRPAVVAAKELRTVDVRLTPRERDVISLIAEGLSNKEIAVRLHIATHTVKSHVRNVMEKLALHTRLQIAAYAHGDPKP